MEKIKKLITDLESESQELRDGIIERIKSISDESLKFSMLEDPFSLDLVPEDNEDLSYHAYDLGRLEAFEEIIRELKNIK